MFSERKESDGLDDKSYLGLGVTTHVNGAVIPDWGHFCSVLIVQRGNVADLELILFPFFFFLASGQTRQLFPQL